MKTETFNTDISFDLPKNKGSEIKVIGVGGGGCNAVNYMFIQGILGVDFVVANTDSQHLEKSPIVNKIQMGSMLTEGLGAGANPEVGKQAAEESIKSIQSILDSRTKMVFITAGMGGGTGTGAAPVFAKMAKDRGILTIGIFTVPFQFEEKKRLTQAQKGLQCIKQHLDSLIVINNNKLLEVYGDLGYKNAFAKADEVLLIAAKGMAEVITKYYTQNIDLRDVRTVLADSGTAIMGSAADSGQNRAQNVIKKALHSPLLNDNRIDGCKNVLLLIVSGKEEVTINEIEEITGYIREQARNRNEDEAMNNINIIMGIGEDPDLGESISVTIIATGFQAHQQLKMTNIEEKKIIHTLNNEQVYNKNFVDDNFNYEQREEIISNPLKDDQERILDEQNGSKEKIFQEKKILEDSIIINDLEENNDSKNRLFEKENNKEEKHIVDNEMLQFGMKLKKEKVYKRNLFEEKQSENTINFKLLNKEMEVQNPIEKKGENENKPSYNFDYGVEKLKKNIGKINYNMNKIEDLEKQPAYERKGIQLKSLENKNFLSRYSVEKDKNGDVRVRDNNSYLHDNVD